MAMIKCSKCGKDISDKAKVCPSCGESTDVTASNEKSIENNRDEIQYSSVPPKKGFNKGTIIGLIVAVLLIGGVIGGFAYYRHYTNVIKPTRVYEEADALLQSKKYADAKQMFLDLADFQDSSDKATECDYASASDALANGDYEAAKESFKKIGDYKDSKEMINECDYQKAVDLYDNSLNDSLSIFASLGDYKDSKQYIYDTMLNLAGQEYLDACTEGINDLNTATTSISKELLSVAISGGGSWSLDTSSAYYNNLQADNQKLKELRAAYTSVFTESFISDCNDEKIRTADTAFDDFHESSTKLINTSYLYTYASGIFSGSTFNDDLSDLAIKEQTYNDAMNALKQED